MSQNTKHSATLLCFTLSVNFSFIRCGIHFADITWNLISTFVLTAQ